VVWWLGGAASGCSRGLLVVACRLIKMLIFLHIFFISFSDIFSCAIMNLLCKAGHSVLFLEMAKFRWGGSEGLFFETQEIA